METERIWVSVCPDAMAFVHTWVTKIYLFVNYWGSGFFAARDIHEWLMWLCLDDPNDVAWRQALDEDAGLNTQIIHL